MRPPVHLGVRRRDDNSTEMIATGFLLAFTLHGCVSHAAMDDSCATLLERVNRTTFANFLAKHHMAAIYFQKEGGVQICAFLNEMEHTADELLHYGVAVGLNDCSEEATAVREFCNTEGVHRSLHVFSYGQYLSHVSVGALFGKSAVLSNLLSLRLLEEVAVISSAKDRLQVEHDCAGKCILHGSFVGVGTEEHAAFMKVAHDYKNDASIKFIYGTHPELMLEIGQKLGVSKERVMSASTEQALLIVTCYGADGVGLPEAPAASHVYEGVMDYNSLVSFVASLRERDAVDLGEDPSMSEVAQSFLGRRHVLVAVYDQTVRHVVSEVVRQLTARYYKIIAAVLTDKDGAHRVSNFVNLTAALAKAPLYCLASRQQLRCECILVITDIDQAVQRLSSMIEAYAKPIAVLPHEASITPAPDPLPSHDSDSLLKLMDAVETQDDQVALYASHIRSSMADWQIVPTLTRQNFTSFVMYPSGRLVLFHLKKFDSTSVVALHTLSETLRHLRGTHYNGAVAAVDCYDWTDVCANASTYEYPALRIYRSGTSSGLLSVRVSIEGFATAARLATIANPVHLKTAAEISAFVADSVLLRKPSMGIAAETFSPHTMIVIGAFGGNVQTADVAGFVRASARRDGTSAFGMVFGDSATELITQHAPAGLRAASFLPAIAVWNVYRGELLATPRVYFGNTSDADEVERFLVRASVPAVVELTPAALPAIRAIGQPLVLLFTESETDAAVNVMKHVAVQQQERQQHLLPASASGSLVFAYMLRQAPGAEAILSHYWPGRTSHQALVFVDLNQGAVHRYEGPADRDGFRADDISAWLDGIHNGSCCPHVHLPAKRWLPAHPGYDFLAMVDSDFSLQQHDRLIRQRTAAGAATVAAIDTNQQPPVKTALFEKAAAVSTGERHTEL